MLCFLIAPAMTMTVAFTFDAQIAPKPPLPMQCTLVAGAFDAPSVEPGDALTEEEIA